MAAPPPPPARQTAERTLAEVAEANMFKSYVSRPDLVTWIKLHSTQQGKQVKCLRTASCGHRATFVCDTYHGPTPNTPFQCGYKVVIKRSRSKKSCNQRSPWYMDRERSHYQHSGNCLSRATITGREAKVYTSDKAGGKIKEIQKRIARATKISTGSVPPSVAYQIRLGCTYTSFQNYEGNWGKLDRWGKEFEELNPGSKFHLEVDEEGRFQRMFVGIGSAVRVAQQTGIEFSGIDATFFRHVKYKGRVLILVTRDGNNKLLLLAWVIATKENAVNYKYMAEKVKEMEDLKGYLNRPQHLLYSDRHKGIPAFENEFDCGTAHCIVHVADNAKDWVKKHYGAAVSSMSITVECMYYEVSYTAHSTYQTGSQIRVGSDSPHSKVYDS